MGIAIYSTLRNGDYSTTVSAALARGWLYGDAPTQPSEPGCKLFIYEECHLLKSIPTHETPHCLDHTGCDPTGRSNGKQELWTAAEALPYTVRWICAVWTRAKGENHSSQ